MPFATRKKTTGRFTVFRLFFLWMAVVFVFVSCAGGNRMIRKPGYETGGETRPAEIALKPYPVLDRNKLKNFRLFVPAHPDTRCPTGEPENILHIGKNHKARIVVEFSNPVAHEIAPENLIVRMKGFPENIRFSKAITDKEIITPEISFQSLSPVLNSEPVMLNLFYKFGKQYEKLQGFGKYVILDTVSPPAPANPRVLQVEREHFTIGWEDRKSTRLNSSHYS